MLAVYFFGLAWSVGLLAVGFFRIQKWIEKGEGSALGDGIFLIETDEKDAAASSFFRFIFLPKSLKINELERAEIIAHERAHAMGGHSREAVFFEILSAVFWFQPLVWLLKNRLREAHEFEADSAAARVFSAKQYGQLLLRAASDGLADRRTARGLTNPFFTSPVKIRILMLLQKKSPPASRLRYLAALPIVAALLVFQPKKGFAQDFLPPKNYEIIRSDTFVTFNPDTYAESVQYREHRKKTDGSSDSSFFFVQIDTMPSFPGGEAGMWNFIFSNLKYPADARAARADGLVRVQFIVETDGSLSEIELIEAPPHLSLGEEALRVVRMMPRWKPGTSAWDKKPERVRMSLPFRFKLE